MVFKLLKLPKFSALAWCRCKSRDEIVKRMTLAGLLAAALVTAFYWGRHGGFNEARGQSPQGHLDPLLLKQAAADRGRHVVAYIFGDIPVSREELGEYLVERIGAERLEFLVNRKIIEKACADKGIRVTDAEIKAQLAEELKLLSCTESQFVSNFLRKYNKTMFEYKEDVIRPKLAMQRFVQGAIAIDEKELQKGFEAKYGPKVDCLWIVISKEQTKDKYDIWARASRGLNEFVEEAKKVNPGPLAAEGGKVPYPIHKHFGDPNIENEAFKLKPGEVSPLIGMLDGSTITLHCVKHIPGDITTRSYDQERLVLQKELFDAKVAQMVQPVFNDMRKAANPQMFLKREVLAVDPSSLTTQLQAGPQMSMPGPPPTGLIPAQATMPSPPGK